MRIILGWLFALVVMVPAPVLAQASARRYQVPPVRDDGWKTANADAVGVDSTKLANLTTAIRAWPELGVHAVLIERNGQLIYEEYFDGFDQKWGTSLPSADSDLTLKAFANFSPGLFQPWVQSTPIMSSQP